MEAVAPDGQCGILVGTGRPPKSQSDASGVQRCQCAKLLSDHQRRVIGKHNSSRPHPDRRSAACDITQQHRGSRTGYIGHVMVLCHPKTFLTNLFCFSSTFQAMPECIGRSTAFEIGTALWRDRVFPYVSILVVAGSLTTKTTNMHSTYPMI